MKKIAVHASAARLQQPLTEMGYELFAYGALESPDALLYECAQIPPVSPSSDGTLLVFSGGKQAHEVAEILQQRSYAPLITPR